MGERADRVAQYLPPIVEDDPLDLESEIDELSITEEDESTEDSIQELLRSSTNSLSSPVGSEDDDYWRNKFTPSEPERKPFQWGSGSKEVVPPYWPGQAPKSYGNYSDNFRNNMSSNQQSSWGSGSNTYAPSYSNNYGREKITRDKDIIFCDFLDGIAETYQSQGRPGYLPRGVFDLKPRFEVWDKLGMLRPERIYILAPQSLLTSGNSSSWGNSLSHMATCLCEYLRVPDATCVILSQTYVGQTKADVIRSWYFSQSQNPHSTIGLERDKSKMLFIGLESGEAGQGFRDIQAADELGIEYLDLNRLLTRY